MQRVLVYGVTGSGKTTLAEQIGGLTGLPWHSVDDEIGWLPGWVERPESEQRELVAAIVAQDAWVLDTAYGRWLDLPLSRVDLIVGLDYPRLLSLGRLVRRTLTRVLDRRLICNGNVERWPDVLSKDSIIRWHFRSFARKRARIRAWAADPGGPRVVVLRTPQQTRRWLAGLARAPR